MTREARIAEIEAREKAATKGPWAKMVHDCRDGYSNGEWWTVNRADETPVTIVARPAWLVARVMSMTNGANDAAFMAHARADIPWLLEEVKRLRSALQRIENGACDCRGSDCTRHCVTIAAVALDGDVR